MGTNAAAYFLLGLFPRSWAVWSHVGLLTPGIEVMNSVFKMMNFVFKMMKSVSNCIKWFVYICGRLIGLMNSVQHSKWWTLYLKWWILTPGINNLCSVAIKSQVNFASNMMNLSLKMMNLALKMMNFFITGSGARGVRGHGQGRILSVDRLFGAICLIISCCFSTDLGLFFRCSARLRSCWRRRCGAPCTRRCDLRLTFTVSWLFCDCFGTALALFCD